MRRLSFAPAGLRHLALALPLLLASCAAPGSKAPGPGHSPTPARPADGERPVQVISAERIHAWSDVKRIARLLAQAPAPAFPGLSHLAQQIDQLQRDVEVGGQFRLERVDPDRLIAHNPAFWRAQLEIVPSDPLPAVFAALVYFSAGQPGVANELLRLVRAGPLLPEPLDRRIELHLDGSVEADDFQIQSVLQTMVEDYATFRAEVEALRVRFPHSPNVAHLAVSVRGGDMGVSLDPTDNFEAEKFAELVSRNSAEIALITRERPVAGLLFRLEPELRERLRTAMPIWQQSAELRFGLSAADFEALADLFRAGDLPIHALFARRLMAATRGFGAPSDAKFAERTLLALLSPPDSAALLNALQNGEIAQLAFFEPAPAPESSPLHPLHPALAESLERTRRRATYVLEAPGNPPEVMAEAYLLRSQVLRQAGRFDEAAADLARLEALEGRSGRVAFAQFYQAFDTRDLAAAERALEDLRPTVDNPLLIASEEAFAAALRQDWRAAAAAFTRHSELEDDLERSGFSRLHAALASRFSGDPLPDDRAEARERHEPGAWIHDLLGVLTPPEDRSGLLNRAMAGSTELDRAGRLCEAHFALAALAAPGSDEMRTQLENCVRTGLADFIEYQLARLYLEQRYPERWDDRRRPAPPAPETPPVPPAPREFDDTVPRPVAPA